LFLWGKFVTSERFEALEGLNGASRSDFVAVLEGVFERAPWVAEAAFSGRPYARVAALHEAMMAAVHEASHEQKLDFLRGHPELGSRLARASGLTDASEAEQGSLGLDRLSDAEFEQFEQLNTAYRDKFGFPFIICVRRHTRDSILANFARRIGNDVDTEFATAVAEIGFITRLRLNAKIDGPGKPKTNGELTTHVLDTLDGQPAAGVAVALYEIGASARGLLTTTTTNADGRTDRPLIAGEPLRIGTYELQFGIGAYFARVVPPSGSSAAALPFLDVVPIRFSIAEPEGHYHVPLLATPWSMTTYRGS
jgi:2-oxo-4-hydroxy-4-carboxy-5-ureidoimidazoline decarboxylase